MLSAFNYFYFCKRSSRYAKKSLASGQWQRGRVQICRCRRSSLVLPEERIPGRGSHRRLLILSSRSSFVLLFLSRPLFHGGAFSSLCSHNPSAGCAALQDYYSRMTGKRRDLVRVPRPSRCGGLPIVCIYVQRRFYFAALADCEDARGASCLYRSRVLFRDRLLSSFV